MPLHLGIDVGSTTVKAVITDDDFNILFSDYSRHYSDIKKTVSDLFDKISVKFSNTEFSVVFTGSGGLLISSLLDMKFTQEVIATKKAVQVLLPDTDTVIELGGEDAKILYLSGGLEQRMNGTCAGGTGSFIDQMSVLLKTDAAGLNKLAQMHKNIYPIAARCGVFAKSDVQPLLNEGAAKEDIAASVLQAVVTQTISGLAQGRQIAGNIVFLGGPLFFLPELRKLFEKNLVKGTSFTIPDNAQLFIALGASMLHDNAKTANINSLRAKLREAKNIKSEITRMPPLFSSPEDKKAFDERHAKACVSRAKLASSTGRLFLGLDVGSTTIKAALIDSDGKLLYSYYAKNEGSPIKCGIQILRELYPLIPKNAYIAGSCVTGYGEMLMKNAFNIDENEIETIAHFKAAEFFLPGVDFIIDIGGQDMKCLKIKDGAIDSIMLNEACSSGCGSFLQTFSESLGMDIESFAKAALESQNPVDLGTRCTVFMNSRVKQAQKEGASVGDISAGLSYSVVRNALYKVIKLRNSDMLGNKIVVQGGTFNNDAILRAFETVIGKNVIRPDIAGIMGAFGCALIAKERCKDGASSIISLDELDSFEYKNTLTRCKGCSNQCRLTITSFAGGRKFVSGNRCEKGAGLSPVNKNIPNLYDYKYKRLFAYTPLDNPPNGVIGIPRVLNMYENYPLWFTFFTKLGFKVVLSSESSHDIYEKGIESIPSESACYPAKIVHGHIQDLIDKGIKNIFYPCVPYEQQEFKDTGNHYCCPIVTSYPEVICQNMDALRLNNINFIYPFLNLDNIPSVKNQLAAALSGFNIPKNKIFKAVDDGFAELAAYKADVRRKGEETVRYINENNIHAIVLAGRPYHIDPEINHGIPKIISSLGFAVLSEDSVAHLGLLERPIRVVDQWVYHTRLYEAAAFTIKQPLIELVQLNSFGCGLDAVTSEQIQEILEAGQKLYTTLKIDEISNLGTAKIRLRSLNAAISERDNTPVPNPDYSLKRPVFTADDRKNHTIIFPQMSPIHFKLFEAVFKLCGYNAQVLDKATKEDIETGLKFINNDACYPSIIVAGQLVNAFISGKYNPENTSVMITQTGGGCRATNYIAFLRKALAQAGFPNVAVISLSMTGIEKNPGFTITPKMVVNLVRTCILGDLLMTLQLRIRPYEVKKGETNRMLKKWVKKIHILTANNKLRINFKKLISSIISDFDKIKINNVSKPRVGIVGEILVKFHPDANNNLVKVIEKEGGEAIVPSLLDFFLYCLYNADFRHKNLGLDSLSAKIMDSLIKWIEHCRSYTKKMLLKNPKFADYAPVKIKDIAENAKKILNLGHFTGEGWLLTGEMIELIEKDIPNIVCVQPFACLPNHVTGKGMIKAIRRKFQDANIVTVDYDPGASEVNQLNRIKLMIEVAFENLKINNDDDDIIISPSDSEFEIQG